ncbi:MAG: fused response regulator/phosphatase [Alphaproteobacteria bacterium]|nr:fused response regulator/phosphatase [Alphaproteobacteria bacterium]
MRNHLEKIKPQSLSRILEADILVVEDNHLSQRMIVEALRNFGFHRIHCAYEGMEALELLKNIEPDLIITDLLMPTLDGFSLCQKIRRHPRLKDIPILALTALDDEKARLSVFEMGANDLVRKPVTEEELNARCRLHLEKRYILKDLQDYQSSMSEDIGHARDMQNLLMPDSKSVQEIENQFDLGISSLFVPSFTISGDFWGMRPLCYGSKLAFYIGDFTGHGVTAAINVFRFHMLIEKMPASLLMQPATCLNTLNHQLYKMLPIQLFCTLFYAVLDLNENTLNYCIAGCPHPLKLHCDNGYEMLLGVGLPLAATKTVKYKEYSTTFMKGDALMLYSDALVETPNEKNNYLKIQEVGELLNNTPQDKRDAPALLKSVLDQFSDFTHKGIDDDLTINIYTRN